MSVWHLPPQEVGDDFIRQIIAAFDEHQSRENAKNTHRCMVENAVQGFWNGSRPPFGYSIVVKEVRGKKEKKVLVVNEPEASVVRMIAGLYLGRNGRPLGLKGICNHLNERGILRRGHRWGIGSLQDLLTSRTYRGEYIFNRVKSRTGQKRPPSEWITVPVPAVLSEEDFDRIQATLHERSPRKTPPRVVNGPTMLAGVARCARCGAAMILNTGKGARYRYYACSNALKKGKTVCAGQRIRMDELDETVIDHLSRRIFDSGRLEKLLTAYMRTQEANAAGCKERLQQLRQRLNEAHAGRARLIHMVESGVTEPDDPLMKERMVQLRLQASEIEKEIEVAQAAQRTGTPAITPEGIRKLSQQMRDRLRSGPPDLRQSYMRLLLSSVEVGQETITLRGSNAVLERLAANEPSSNASEVLSFARKWRPGRDSNP